MRLTGIADKVYQKKLPGQILINVNPTEHIQRQLFWYGYYEKPVGDLLKKLLRPGNTFVDVGANIGYFSLLASGNFPRGRIISLEPVSKSFEALKANIALNKINNIEAFNIAAGKTEETSTIYLAGDDNTGMSSLHQPENYSGQTEMVKVTRLDQLAVDLKLEQIDVIKIDVEGYELAVLEGMKEVMEKFRPHILLELNPHTLSYFNLKPADVINYTAGFSYDAYSLAESGKLTQLSSENPVESIDVFLVHKSNIEATGLIV